MARIAGVLFVLSFLFDISSGVCNECNCCYGENACDADNKCTNGCIAGYLGDKCTESCRKNCKACVSGLNCAECHPGYHGAQCAFECGKGCMNNTCLQSGECACKSSDFKGLYCSSCSSSNKYGDECNYTCPPNCGACTSQTECSWCKNFFTYGSYCQLICSVGCVSVKCSKDGICQTGCKPGYTGGKCDSCVSGKYGQNCDLDCPSNCSSCLSNSNCTECKQGFYGEICTNICSPGCNVCSIASGKCNGCKQGFYGDFCNDTKSCEDGFYGNNCSKSCIDKDTHCQKCLSNELDVYSGCLICTTGYYPELPNAQNHSICTSCSNECKGRTCNSTGICTNGCSLGMWGVKCKNECLVNCSKCDQIDGKCVKCKNGTYSVDCSKVCSSNCSSSDSDEICDVYTGECINECNSYNKYGNFCEYQCSETCINQTCNWKTGYCSYGCVENYHGSYCKNECAPTCKSVDNKSLCNDSNGHCISGCKNGFHGGMCTSTCSEKCTNKTCDRFTAECLYGCINGYDGMQCTQERKAHVSEETSKAMTVGSSVGAGVVIIIVIVVVLTICFIKHKRRKSTCEQENIERNGNLKTIKDDEEQDKRNEDMDAAAIYAKPYKPKRTIVDEANSVYDTTFKNKRTFKGNSEYDVIGSRRKYTSNEDDDRSDNVEVNALYDTTFDIRNKRDFKGINERSDKAGANALYDQTFGNRNLRALKGINERSNKADANALYDTTFDNGNKGTLQGNNDYAVLSGERNITPDDENQNETSFGQNSSTKQ